MKKKLLGFGLLAMGVVGLCSLVSGGAPEAVAEEAVPEVRALPECPREGGMGIYEAMSRRASGRDFDEDGKLSDEAMAKILWAACGVNRPDGRWTIPTALNTRDLRVYVLDADGVWLYDPEANALALRSEGDRREMAGMQGFVAKAAVNLVYVTDTTCHAGRPMPLEGILRCSAFEAGCAAQDVALVCASEGLKNVVRGSYPEEELRTVLGLPETSYILMAQSVGP
jgi:nitroreductase